MRQVDVVADQDHERVPPLYRLLATAPSVREARLQAYSFSEQSLLLLFSVDGRPDVETEIAELPFVRSIDVTSAENGVFALFVEMDRDTRLGQLFYSLGMEWNGILVLPVVLRDGKMHSRWVGKGEDIGEVFADSPAEISEGIVRITRYWAEQLSLVETFTDRQREVVRTAVEMGHFDVPRRATHADIADELGCSAPTVTEHLRKAEGRLFRRLFPVETSGPSEGSGARGSRPATE